MTSTPPPSGFFYALRTEQITHSERVAIGEAIEQELGDRNGKRPTENFPEVRGETRDLAAKAAGFGRATPSRRTLSTFVDAVY